MRKTLVFEYWLNTIFSVIMVHRVIKYKQYIYGSENKLDLTYINNVTTGKSITPFVSVLRGQCWVR